MAVKAVGRPSENQDDDYDSPAVCKIHVENIAATNYEKAPTTVIPIKNREVKALMDTDGYHPEGCFQTNKPWSMPRWMRCAETVL
jgi:hypothetical protein